MQLESADVEVGSPGWEVVAVESDSAVDDATDAYPWVVALVDAVVGTDICEAFTPREKSLVDMPIVGNGGNALAARDESLVDVSVVDAELGDSRGGTLADELFGEASIHNVSLDFTLGEIWRRATKATALHLFKVFVNLRFKK